MPATDKSPLREGITTGSCATAAAVAAACFLLHDETLNRVTINLPRGGQLSVPIEGVCKQDSEHARATVIKDAGDDPDVTHGARIVVDVFLVEQGVCFEAGEGVGTVTLPGLSLPVGEPAINPVPRRMISEHLQYYAGQFHYRGGFRVRIGVENGELLARKTMNARLGIIGGLSILGTSGIVKPFSCSAYIASIYQGLDVALCNGAARLLVCTGTTSEAFLQKQYARDPNHAFIEVADFVDVLVNYMKKKGGSVPVMFAAGFAKSSKIACGHMKLHRRDSSVDFEALAEMAKNLGATAALRQQVIESGTAQAVLALCEQARIPIGEFVAKQAKRKLHEHLPQLSRFYCVDRQSQCIGQA